jgi:putative DNA methylase
VTPTPSIRKKLIEVALPLPEINDASSYDKMPGIGPHPKGIHHWWARLPLPSARAVLFASVVTDPEDDPAWKDKSAEQQDAERERLFGIMRRLMGKKLHEQPAVYEEARKEMLRHCDGKLPPVLDPFSGGGSIPLEAARLGFEAHAADLNPVAVLLNKCNLELAPRWVDRPPVNPEDRKRIGGAQAWRGTHGLAADVRYYGRLIRAAAQEKIGHLYPKVHLPKEHGGGEANVIAWLWARTVASQDPAAKGAHVPLLSSFSLCAADGKSAWLEPVVDRATHTYRFLVRTGTPTDRAAIKAGTKLGRGAKFKCILSDQPLDDAHIKAEGEAGRLGYKAVAKVVEVKRGRIFMSVSEEEERLANVVPPENAPMAEMADDPRNIWCAAYGIKRFDQLFTPRQLTTLVILSDEIKSIQSQVKADAQKAGLDEEDASAYAITICTFLALALDRTASFNNTMCRWNGNQTVFIFTRQAIPMMWDFSEANIMGERAVCWHTAVDICAEGLETIAAGKLSAGYVAQADAAQASNGDKLLVSTDPPYYDNISYAGLSDFYYVWLRRTVGDLYRPIFDTLLVPKMPELTASPERFNNDRDKAKEHFESGFRGAFTNVLTRLDPRFPLTVYYAFKQEDDEDGGTQNENESAGGIDLTTGWETLLKALISSGFSITATWPVRASFKWRSVALDANTLASYIVLACRPRPADAPRVGRNAFVAELKRELPAALRHLQQGNVAPVDFAQAAIGPGMAVFSKYSAILESSGKPMKVRTALALINGLKDELLGESVEELDRDTRWAMLWFEERGFDWGEAGEANLLANAQATAVNGVVTAGIVETNGNQVRLLPPEEMRSDWDPWQDRRQTVWEMTHQLLRIYYYEKKGDEATAALLRKIGARGDVARDLAYKLFTVAENKKRTAEAQAYNALVLGWPELAKIAEAITIEPAATQGRFL